MVLLKLLSFISSLALLFSFPQYVVFAHWSGIYIYSGFPWYSVTYLWSLVQSNLRYYSYNLLKHCRNSTFFPLFKVTIFKHYCKVCYSELQNNTFHCNIKPSIAVYPDWSDSAILRRQFHFPPHLILGTGWCKNVTLKSCQVHYSALQCSEHKFGVKGSSSGLWCNAEM